MRILHVHKYFYERAGAERYMFELMRMQEEAGHVVAPFSMHHTKNRKTVWSRYFVSELATEGGIGKGAGAIRQLARAFWSREAARNLKNLLEDFKPDIVHVHNAYTHLSPSILKVCKAAGIPIVLTLHDYALLSANYSLWDAYRKRSMNPARIGLLATAKTRYIKGSLLATIVLDGIVKLHHYFRLYRKRVDRFFAISNAQRDIFLQHGFSEEQIALQYNFVSPQCQPRKPKNKIVFVGQLRTHKGPQLLIDAMKHFPDTELRIMGRGEELSALKKQAKGMDNITFFGFVSQEELGKELSQAKCAVFPSLWEEPFGLVLVEAMQCGVPVIVSNRGAFPEIVEDGVAGLIFDPDQPETLVHAIKELIEKDAICQALSEAGQERAGEIADPQEHLQAIMQHYSGVIQTVDNS